MRPTLMSEVRIACLSALLIACSATEKSAESAQAIRVRLQWVKQAQFAGFLVADAKGFYKEMGLNIELLPAGPDLKPHQSVANGSEQIGIAVPNQIILARSQNVPLVIVAQVLQGSANRYIARRQSGITGIQSLKGKKVGLWTGGDEAEFVAMLASKGMVLKDVTVVPQGFTVVPFLRGDYVLSQVTVYNELNQVLRTLSRDSLTILDPADFAAAIPADVIITTDAWSKQHHDDLVKFLAATIRGWDYCRANSAECLSIVLESNKDLDRADQEAQLRVILEMAYAGIAHSAGFGEMSAESYRQAQDVLLRSGQLPAPIDLLRLADTTLLSEGRAMIVAKPR